MRRKKVTEDSKNIIVPSGPSYIVANDETAMADTLSKASEEYNIVQHARAGYYADLRNLQTGVSGRPGLEYKDYYAFRPNEAPPEDIKAAIYACEQAYYRVGIIRNIIDLMGDFACQGMRPVHPNKKIERFYRYWWKKINGQERSERFMNNFYRSGNVVARRITAKINVKTERKWSKVTSADTEITENQLPRREIPIKYTFLHPCTIENLGGPLSSFLNTPVLGLKLNSALRRAIKNPKPYEVDLIKKLPLDIQEAATSTNGIYPLPVDKVRVFYYKKDDWLPWAYPMIYGLLDDVYMLEKLKLADSAALDGAISNIRIFKLGSLEHKIAPTQAVASRLSQILQSNVGGGTVDLVWGPDIELVESKTQVHNFLGEGKYKPHLFSIYSGLGIPPSLTGTFGNSGTTNNYISLKALVQRLEYGRAALMAFWQEELRLIQEAMGFRLPASLEFDISVLGDEQAEKALLIQLSDRNLISDEYLQSRFKHDPDMEKVRLLREDKERYKGKRIPKSSPYHNPQFGLALKRIALQTGTLSPSQVGLMEDANIYDLRLEPKSPNDVVVDSTSKTSTQTKKKGQPQQGRPVNSRDTKKRKTKVFKPKIKASLFVWANKINKDLTKYLSDIFLKQTAKASLRELTNEESENLEKIKASIFFELNPFDELNPKMVLNQLETKVNAQNIKRYNSLLNKTRAELCRELTLEESRQVQILTYLYIQGKKNVD